MKPRIIISSFLAIALLLPLSVSAAQVQGQIGLAGVLLPKCGGADCGLDVADVLDIVNDTGLVAFAVGDFTSGVAFGDVGTFYDLVLGGSQDTLWYVGAFALVMETIIVEQQASNYLLATGTGHIIAKDPDLDTAQVIWTFSADVDPGTSVVSWSSTATTVVPAPAALWLMVGALGALIGLRRKA